MQTMEMIDDVPADIREMYVVHTALRREFGLLRTLVLAVEDEDRERATVVADHIDLLCSVLHRHHLGEDTHIWPKLLERCAEAMAPLVHMIEGQHADIDRAMAEVEARLAMWRGSANTEQAAVLAQAIDVLVTELEGHLQLEEQHMLPLIEKHITASEWNQMGEDGGADTPSDEAAVIFGMMMYEGDAAVLQDMFSHMPPEVAAVLGDIAPTAYAEYSRKIHGTPTPRRGAAV